MNSKLSSVANLFLAAIPFFAFGFAALVDAVHAA